MAYCTRNDLIKRFGESEINDLLDRNNDLVNDTQTLDMRIEDADSTIDGFLGKNYAVPITSVKSLLAIKPLACDIVRYLLWDDNAPVEVRTRYEDAIGRLKDYAKGVMVLPEAEAAPQNPSGGVDYIAEERLFSRESLSGF